MRRSKKLRSQVHFLGGIFLLIPRQSQVEPQFFLNRECFRFVWIQVRFKWHFLQTKKKINKALVSDFFVDTSFDTKVVFLYISSLLKWQSSCCNLNIFVRFECCASSSFELNWKTFDSFKVLPYWFSYFCRSELIAQLKSLVFATSNPTSRKVVDFVSHSRGIHALFIDENGLNGLVKLPLHCIWRCIWSCVFRKVSFLWGAKIFSVYI